MRLCVCPYILRAENNIIELMGKLRTLKRAIGLMNRVFANGPGDQGSIPDQIVPKTKKMVIDAALLNTQHYKVRIKNKVEKSREKR